MLHPAFRRTAKYLTASAMILAVLANNATASELTANGTFNDGNDAWWWTGNLDPVNRDGQLCVVVPGGLSNPWDAIVGQNTIVLLAGGSYKFAFTATGDPKGQVRALVQMPAEPYTSYVTINARVSAGSTSHEAGFVSPVSRRDAQIVFQLGGSVEERTVCLDDVSLKGTTGNEVYKADTGPDIRVNQLGYLPDGPKRATIVSDAPEPLEFAVANAAGETVFTGITAPRGFDETAGVSVHSADFSGLSGVGPKFVLRAAGQESYPFAVQPGLYKELRTDALRYFYLARSGIDIDAALVGEAYARPAGHVSSPSDGVPNKGDRDVPCQPASVSLKVYGEPWTCGYTLSPVGGWYDAGDHGKYVVNGGISVAQLLSAFEWAQMKGPEAAAAIGDSSLPVPERGNGIPDILDEARWELDFFEKMAVPKGDPLAGMVHHKIHDNQWTGVPMLPHLSGKVRELHRPSTSATLNAAAAFAQAARVFEPYDAAYASHALALAKSFWEAARAHPAVFATPEDGQSGGGPYDDIEVSDEFYWAAAELFLTTGEGAYLDYLKGSPLWDGGIFAAGGFDWHDVGPYARMQLAMHGEKLEAGDAAAIRRSIAGQADALIALQEDNPFGHAYAPDSGRYDWGSSHMVLQNGILLAAAFELTGEEKYRTAAIETADYVLGRNALNISYVTGYGTVFSENQHSRWFANQVDADLPHPPKGALSGGPNSSIQDPVAQRLFAAQGCAAQTCYVDDIESWSTNEITINWNAALAQYAAWLAEQ
jgi:endoglucanase